MTRILRSSASAVLAAAYLSACGSLPNAAPPVTQGNAGATSAHRAARLELRLKIPPRARRAHYVSPSTKSIVVTEGSTKVGTFDTTPSSAGCTTFYGSTLCTFKAGLKPDKHVTISVASYDGTGGTGNLLSTGQIVTTVAAGLNVIPITLGGVVKSVAIALSNPNSPAGTSATLPIAVMAQDADGNTIVGPGTYSTPITLTDSDTSGATAITGASVTSPNDRPALSYDGSKSVTSATIGASNVANVTTAAFAPTPKIVGDFILPTSIGPATDLSIEPVAIVTGSDKNLWVSAFDNVSHHAIMVMTPGGQFTTTFVPGTAPSTNLPEDLFSGLALGSDRNVWYIGQHNVGNITTGGSVTNYALTSIPGMTPSCATPIGKRITNAADGGLWFTIACSLGPTLLVHATTTGVFKIATLPPNVKDAFGVVAATDGNVYVAINDNSVIGAILRARVTGDTVNATDIVDVPNAGVFISGIAQAANGDIWATNSGCDTSLIIRLHLASGFAPSSLSTYPTNSGCEAPEYLTALPDGSLWVPENADATVTQVIPKAAGSPFMYDLPFPSPHSIQGEGYDSTIGPNGNVYVTNYDQDKAGFSSNVLEVAY